mmetsp:Transcript_26314/g.76430  ORF Transcript_26314/g.76430 Transcript_26314/m.76430 type:complete len:162 (-) Transcript_26314:408-893(-)
MRLVTHNREVCIMKHQSQQLFCSDPPAGVGAIITRFLDGGGVGGLNAGDRLLAVNGKLVTDGAEQLSRRLQDSAGEVKLVVSGYTTAHSLRKEREGGETELRAAERSASSRLASAVDRTRRASSACGSATGLATRRPSSRRSRAPRRRGPPASARATPWSA